MEASVNTNAITLLTAIANLWKLALVIVILIAIIIFRKQIKEAFNKRNWKIKKGDMEFNSEIQSNDSDENSILDINKVARSQEEITHNSNESENSIHEFEANDAKPFLKMLKADNEEQLEKCFSELKVVETDKDEKLKNEGIFYFLKFRFGNRSALSKLENLCSENKKSPIISNLYNFLGLAYKESKKYEDAADKFKIAAELSDTEEMCSDYKIFEYECKLEYTKIDVVIRDIHKLLESTSNNEAKFNYYKELCELYKHSNQPFLACISLEKALSCIVNDKQIHFKIAYALAEIEDFEDVAILYYSKLLSYDNNHAYALNNIGVSYTRMGINGKAIENYQKSILQKNSLAVSNLCYKLIEIGFYDEVEKYIKQTIDDGIYDEDMIKVNNYLIKEKKDEKERLDKVLEKASEKQKFISEFADAYFVDCKASVTINGKWSGGLDTFEITLNDKIITLNWENSKYKAEGSLNNMAGFLDIQKYEYDFSKKEYRYLPYGHGYILIQDEIKMMIFENNATTSSKDKSFVLNKIDDSRIAIAE